MDKKTLEYFKGDELAAEVWWNKYRNDELKEKEPKDMWLRMASEFARIERKYNSEEVSKLVTHPFTKTMLSKYGQERKLLSLSKIYNFFENFKYIIPQGSIMQSLGTPYIASLSNCLVAGEVEDSYGGIMYIDEYLVQAMKRRMGVGIDLSKLRPENTKTNNVAKTSTGAISFMDRFSNTTREVAQSGRRGALMISMDIRHPDILEFIKIKRDLTKITGANISIKLNDEFMKAVENDEDYILRFPIINKVSDLVKTRMLSEYGGRKKQYNGLVRVIEHDQKGYYKLVKAKELWNEIIKSAHNVAEPGLMYWNRMIDYAPDGVYDQFKAITTNPCSEIGMGANDACRLIALNMFSFVKYAFTTESKFDYKKWYEYVYEAQRLSDDLIDLEVEKIDLILQKIENDPEDDIIKSRERLIWQQIKETALASRRTGLGFTGLGDTLAALNVKYDSDKALKIVESIMKTKMQAELDATIDMAILRGTFEGWDLDKEYEKENDIDNDRIFYWGQNSWYSFIQSEFPMQFKRMRTFGRRNVSFSTVAPTGSLSMLAGTTSGIEPLFMPFYIRRKKIDKDEAQYTQHFQDDNGDLWKEFPVLHPKFKEWLLKFHLDKEEDIENYDFAGIQELYELSPWYGSTANDIDWNKRVQMQALIQKYVTHSISSTVNLPGNVTEEEVSNIYKKAWELGIKGITVYRDGSRSGILLSQKSDKNETKFNYTDAFKRPEEIDGEAMTIQVAGKKISAYVGLIEGKPYEIFLMNGSTKNRKGKILKEGAGKYIFSSEGHKDKIITNVTPEQEFIGRLASGALRHGMHPKYIIKIAESAGIGILDFTGALKKALAKFLKNEDISDKICPSCGDNNLVYEEGCKTCKSCGWSACG